MKDTWTIKTIPTELLVLLLLLILLLLINLGIQGISGNLASAQEPVYTPFRPPDAFGDTEPTLSPTPDTAAGILCTCKSNKGKTNCEEPGCACSLRKKCGWHASTKTCTCDDPAAIPTPFSACGNGIVEAGEDCDGSAGCTSDEVCDSSCSCLTISASPEPI